jgi:hypothetical protein
MDFDLGRAQNRAHSRRTRVSPPRLADMGRRILPAPPTPYPRSCDHPERVVQRPLRDTGVSPTRMRMRDDRRGVESQISTPAKRTPRFDREKFLAEKYFFTCCFWGDRLSQLRHAAAGAAQFYFGAPRNLKILVARQRSFAHFFMDAAFTQELRTQ